MTLSTLEEHLANAHALLARRLGDGFLLRDNPAHGFHRLRPHGEESISFTWTTKHLPFFNAYLNVHVRYTAAQALIERTEVLRPEFGVGVMHNSAAILSARRLPSYVGWRHRIAWTLRRPPVLFPSALERPVEHVVDVFEGIARAALLPFLEHFSSIEAARESLEREDGGTLGLDRIGALVAIDAHLRDKAHLASLRRSMVKEHERRRFDTCLSKVVAHLPDLALDA